MAVAMIIIIIISSTFLNFFPPSFLRGFKKKIIIMDSFRDIITSLSYLTAGDLLNSCSNWL